MRAVLPLPAIKPVLYAATGSGATQDLLKRKMQADASCWSLCTGVVCFMLVFVSVVCCVVGSCSCCRLSVVVPQHHEVWCNCVNRSWCCVRPKIVGWRATV